MKRNTIGYVIPVTIFCVLTCFVFWCQFDQRQVSNLGSHGSIVPNLERAAESFRLSYSLERNHNKSLEIQDSEAWRELNDDLVAYAGHLELHQEQQRRRSLVVMLLYMLSAFSMVYFSFRKSKGKKGADSLHDKVAHGNPISLPESKR